MQSILTESDLYERLTHYQAILEGHFHLSSCYHSDTYIQCAKLLCHPYEAQNVATYLADLINAYSCDFDVVVAPAMGGLIIGHEVAKQFGVPFLFTERVDGKMQLRRGFELTKGQKVLIVEDVITTGKSTQETIDVIESFHYQAKLIGVASIIDRRIYQVDFGVPYYPGMRLDPKIYPPSICPLCLEGKPLVKPGSRP